MCVWRTLWYLIHHGLSFVYARTPFVASTKNIFVLFSLMRQIGMMEMSNYGTLISRPHSYLRPTCVALAAITSLNDLTAPIAWNTVPYKRRWSKHVNYEHYDHYEYYVIKSLYELDQSNHHNIHNIYNVHTKTIWCILYVYCVYYVYYVI